MSMLDDILEKTKSLPVDEQLKQICDQIQEEEQKKFNEGVLDDMPVGPNIFLSIQVPGITGKETCFVCLEREFPGQYITGLWSKVINKNKENKKPIKRTRVWEIKETSAKKILESYAKILTFMKGK